ncbi:hypothetical protein [Planktotalea sp.]|uniref:hypothetical protein n=1 Tax=Planktotalea sp. TaxID=2029877 RepID=UPI003F6A9AE0
MNRRDFTRGLASFGLTPALPLPAFGAGSASTATAAASAEHMYFMGWYTARLNKTCSPETLIRELKLKPDVAHEIFAKLVKSKTVSAPNMLGVSRTMDPLRDTYARVTAKLGERAVPEPRKLVQRDVLSEANPSDGEDVPFEDKVDLEAVEPSEAAQDAAQR